MTPPRRHPEVTAESNTAKARLFAGQMAAKMEAKVREKQASWDAEKLAQMTEAASALRVYADTGDDTRLKNL
jgi:hypothetical protein